MSLFSRRKRRADTADQRAALQFPSRGESMGKGTLLTNPASWDSMMPAVDPFVQPKHPFGARSREVYGELDVRLQRFVSEVADHWDVSLIEGYRSPERQLELYDSGDSKVKVGKHNTSPSQAVDMAPYPIDWNDIDQFIRFTYFCKGLAAARGIRVRNGADWDGDNDYSDHTFLDWVHWELVT